MGPVILFLILGVVLFGAFILWFCLVNKKLSKTMVLLFDTILIVLSIVVIVMGFGLRNDVLDANREAKFQQITGETVSVDDASEEKVKDKKNAEKEDAEVKDSKKDSSKEDDSKKAESAEESKEESKKDEKSSKEKN